MGIISTTIFMPLSGIPLRILPRHMVEQPRETQLYTGQARGYPTSSRLRN
ncbi:hypothetical protein Gotur_003700 [Gossypium turneri]